MKIITNNFRNVINHNVFLFHVHLLFVIGVFNSCSSVNHIRTQESKNKVLISNISEFYSALNNVKPDDVLILKNGIWQDVEIDCNISTCAENPITIQAETPGCVILTGSSTLTFSNAHYIVNGLFFKDGSINRGSVVSFNADSCYLVNSAIVDYNPKDAKQGYVWVKFTGSYNSLLNCFFKGKNNLKPLVYNASNRAKHNVISYCHFKDIPLIKNENGREIIRITGFGHSDEKGDNGAYAKLENNLFENANGEGVEIISLKSNHNIVRNNTILNSCGGLVSRRGNNNLFENNIIKGNYKKRTFGIRISSENNLVINNYIENVAGSGILLTSGEYVDSYLTEEFDSEPRMKNGKLVREPMYSAVKNCNVMNNTIINCMSYSLNIGVGYKKYWKKKQIVLLPEDNIIKNNLIIWSKADPVYFVKQDKQYPLNKFKFNPNTIEGNIQLKNKKTNDDGSIEKKVKKGLTIYKDIPKYIGVDYNKLQILLTNEVGTDWME